MVNILCQEEISVTQYANRYIREGVAYPLQPENIEKSGEHGRGLPRISSKVVTGSCEK